MVRNADVRAFWRDQPFDLQLQPHEGNCDLCFLKGKDKLDAIIRADPARVAWWSAMELVGKGRFVTERSYADLLYTAEHQNALPLDDTEFDAECGLWC